MSARRSGQDQAERLQDCLEALESGATVEEALTRHHEAREELLPLLEMARLVREERPRPAATWRDDVARNLARGRPSGAGGILRPRRWAVRLAAAAAAVTLALGGLVVASADSQPGDALYPLRRGVQRVTEAAGSVIGRSATPSETPETSEADHDASPEFDASDARAPSRSPRRSGRSSGGVGDATGQGTQPRVPVAGSDDASTSPSGEPSSPADRSAVPDGPPTGEQRPAEPQAGREAEERDPASDPAPAVSGEGDIAEPAAAPTAAPTVETDLAPPVPDTGADPDRPPPPEPPVGAPPADPRPGAPGVSPPVEPPVRPEPRPSPTPNDVGLAPVGPGVGVVPAMGSISGRVYDKHGKPLENAKVSIYLAADRFRPSRRGPRSLVGVRADVEGRYRVDGLLPDTYLVAIRNPGFMAGETYYPDAPDRWRAEAVEVLSGRTTGDVDIRQRKRWTYDPWAGTP